MAGRTQHPDNFVMLDGLRGLGAILVLVGHTMPYWGPVWAPSGAVVVDLFFLLSGFVIAFAYEPKFAAGMRAGEFMTHRVVRLYPLYLLGTVAGFLVLSAVALGDADGAERGAAYVLQLVPQLFLLPAPEALGSPDLYSFNVPAWTLFFELAVNLAYVLAYRWLRDTRVLAMLVAACAVALAAMVFTFGRIDAGSDWGTFWAGFARAGFGFFAGVLAYRLVGRPRTAQRRASGWSFVMLAALPLICFIPATAAWRPVVDLTLVVVLGLPLLCAAQGMAPPERLHALFLTGGRISYAVYILHQPFREVAERITWRSPVLIDTAPLGGIAMLVMMLALSWAAERFYDRPVRRWIVERLKRRSMRVGRELASAG
jgi:peptidoglycan/LPS O-acetylase OafA/YrhL